MLKAIVIDDELFAREELIEQLNEIGHIDIIAECGNAIDGLKQINILKPDVVFLDIQMPRITGMELISMLDPETMPNIVFVTAYDEFAVKAFEDNAFDYLLKPIEPARLQKTIKRLIQADKKQDLTPLSQPDIDLIPCSGHNRILLLPSSEIEVASIQASGVELLSKTEKACTQLTLKVLEEKTPLIRCHRQFLINPHFIREIKLHENGTSEIVTQNGHIAQVSRRYLKEIKERLGIHG
ncbi:two-component system response regulator BtsR [Aliivibrio fischeri]|uniref:Two-component system response regulator BtsR n=2 Tax=Aliivibrio fischeri TaxID=668 RepID=A0A6N3YW42_ALIFS|nr:two-component system response regulator BtsR [Aliivibrio fischeri]EHN70787.1 putative two-component response-regulatory protein YehT [Aliivibrio fischeri SR5]MUK44456.1 two-component system response regulator BtsR [Aliivibrio fischeri]MUK60895.1 two-component system response regulator BtsR [Aliivibrio fischeri]MUK79961.1 two-component system response regulator BtsR [Aliivibrio fischeri]MUK85527.1 two-component system response regulator BtsR [Aliivibrio fischeri]